MELVNIHTLYAHALRGPMFWTTLLGPCNCGFYCDQDPCFYVILNVTGGLVATLI